MVTKNTDATSSGATADGDLTPVVERVIEGIVSNLSSSGEGLLPLVLALNPSLSTAGISDDDPRLAEIERDQTAAEDAMFAAIDTDLRQALRRILTNAARPRGASHDAAVTRAPDETMRDTIQRMASEMAADLLSYLGRDALPSTGIGEVLDPSCSTAAVTDENDPRLDALLARGTAVEQFVLSSMASTFLDVVPQIIATAALDFTERENDERIRAFFADRKESYEASELCAAFGVEEGALDSFVDTMIGKQNGGLFPWTEVAWGAQCRWGWRALTRALGDSFARHYPALRAIQPTLIQLPRFLAGDWSMVGGSDAAACSAATVADIAGAGALARWDERGYADEDLAHVDRDVPGFAAAARFGGVK